MTLIASKTLSTSLRQATTALGLSCALALPVWAADAPKPAAAAASAPTEALLPGPPLATLKDKTSYATGVMTARNLVKNQVDFDLDLLVQGLRDGMAGGAIRMNEKELKKVLQSMQADMQRHMSNDRQVKASVARERGVIYQNEFRAKPGTVVLPGNLMYRVITNGNGDKPGDLSTVVVKYRGTLVDGTEFDATPDGKTATLKLGEVITGWREALKHMNAGSKWEVVVPPSLAYGTRGAGQLIGPNETLVFNVELVAVVQ
jgi:FKBP-type peptidyl-prolyl cis-trans isomerase FklB